MVSVYFLDSSALVKRYIAEAGTAWIQQISAPQARHQLIIARIAWVEVLGALARRQREAILSPARVAEAIQAFRFDLDTQYKVVELDRPLAELAGKLVGKHPLRAYDAVQLASALWLQSAIPSEKVVSLTFLTADDRLLTIAQAEGLLTDNPNHHP